MTFRFDQFVPAKPFSTCGQRRPASSILDMQSWAKGLKDRAERAATQLSQVSTAFIPPDDDSEGRKRNDGEATRSQGGAAAGATAVAGGVLRVYRRNV